MSLHDLEVIGALLYLVVLVAYFGHAALPQAAGRFLCRLGLHDDRARELAPLGGYWLVCRRHCGRTKSRADRRHHA